MKMSKTYYGICPKQNKEEAVTVEIDHGTVVRKDCYWGSLNNCELLDACPVFAQALLQP